MAIVVRLQTSITVRANKRYTREDPSRAAPRRTGHAQDGFATMTVRLAQAEAQGMWVAPKHLKPTVRLLKRLVEDRGGFKSNYNEYRHPATAQLL